MSGAEEDAKGRALALGPETTIKALLVLVGALFGAGGLNALRAPQVVVPQAASATAASAEAMAVMKAELLGALADLRAKSAEESGELKKQLATLLAQREDSSRRIAENTAALKELQERTASRYSREDAARDKAAQALRDQRQDDKLEALSGARPPK